jgi:PDZ domain-containing protein
MTQRIWAAVLAVPLLVVLGIYAAVTPMPFGTYAPGVTINVLGNGDDGKPIIEVTGHRTYRDSGQLRMTTVSVTEPNARLDLLTLMRTWFTRDDAIYPYSVLYPDDVTQKQSKKEGQAEMTGSQNAAVAAALGQLGYHYVATQEIVQVKKGMPAYGKLEKGDVLVSMGHTRIRADTSVGDLIAKVPPGGVLPVTVRRDGKLVHLRVSPTSVDGVRLIGVSLKMTFRFPFQVSVDISDSIGGPSAGLMFALSIYDTLTPGSLTSGGAVAGTGTITPGGRVGEIGGIQQKIAGARRDGAQLFLVPPANCNDAPTSDHGSMRLARAATLKQAIAEVTAWGKDHEVKLPQCAAAGGRTS